MHFDLFKQCVNQKIICDQWGQSGSKSFKQMHHCYVYFIHLTSSKSTCIFIYIKIKSLCKILLDQDIWPDYNALSLPLLSHAAFILDLQRVFVPTYFSIWGKKKSSEHSSTETLPMGRNHKPGQPTTHYQPFCQYRHCCRCQTVWVGAFTQTAQQLRRSEKLQLVLD